MDKAASFAPRSLPVLGAALLVAGGLLQVPVQAAAAEASTRRVPVTNPGFEQAGTTDIPLGWRVETAGLPATTAVKRDLAVRHGGASSLVIENPRAASVAVVSEPVSLRVGRLYRLRAFVRTEAARVHAATRYPTAVPACLTMASFPFTNHSPAQGVSTDWTKTETLFIATKGQDAVRLHLGNNGTAMGKAWFDDVELTEVEDITEYIPLETVRWAGEGYRYDDRGWIFLHAEGKPYERGYQMGYLVPDEIVAYLGKLAVQESPKDPVAGWNALRLLADATMFRKYDPEYQEEMRGIAEGAARAGAKYEGRTIDLLDIVTLNSAVDLGQIRSALRTTPHASTGQSFLSAEEELGIPDRLHKCSAFAANGPATQDGKVVFGQLFMWSGYTGVHFNVIADIVPSQGHRLVYQTFPGGIHSGTDFYINQAGIIIGETTVAQTPFDADGTPQSNRIRKAAQYASSIDDAVRILRERNNGLYTNDWPMADIKTNEVAMFLLGTHKDKLWRSSVDPAPFGAPGFFWANNNNRDPEVRKEYVANPDHAPFDLIFSPMNRDVAFWDFYQRKEKLDSVSAVKLWASSPINRPHACDGKVTTTEMAEQLVFLAHYGKVTLREKFPSKESRRMPDLPGAYPHLTLGYSVPSPIFITEKLKEARARAAAVKTGAPNSGLKEPSLDLDAVADVYKVDKKRLWHNTVYPASEAENWLVSGTAAYRAMLAELPDEAVKARRTLKGQLGDLGSRVLYVVSREGDLVPTATERSYGRYGPYQIPRVKGTLLLHQLRLLLGNPTFLKTMDAVHSAYAAKSIDTASFIKTASEAAGKPLDAFVRQWIDRTGLPDPRPTLSVVPAGSKWKVKLEVAQSGTPYHLLTSIEIETAAKTLVRRMEVKGERSSAEFEVADRPLRVVFNSGNDFPVVHDRFYVWPNFSDDFQNTLIVYGTTRQIEANHTLALRWQTTLADNFTETLPPVLPDTEVTEEQLQSRDLIVLGHPEDNRLMARLAAGVQLEFGKNLFRWQGRTYAAADDGLLLVLPNPVNKKRTVYLFIANSALELHDMTRSYTTGLPSWAIFKGAEVKDQGHHPVERFVLKADQAKSR